MNNLNLAFLSDIVLDNEASLPRRPKKERMPVGAHLRVFKNGAVFPSQELIDLLGLEYRPLVQDAEGAWQEPEDPGFGFDVCNSAQFPAFKSPKPVIVISPVSRIHSKLSLFGSVTYVRTEEDAVEGRKLGDPSATVGEQGSKTFGAEELLPMIAEVYKMVPGSKGYIDLNLVGKDLNVGVSAPWEFERPVYVPKVVARGKDKGNASTVRREKCAYYVLIPVPETAGIVGAETPTAGETQQPEPQVTAAATA